MWWFLYIGDSVDIGVNLVYLIQCGGSFEDLV